MKPKVFINSIGKEIKNNVNDYHFKKNDVRGVDNSKNIRTLINELFDKEDFVYKMDVVITLNNNNVIKEEIISLNKDTLITLSDKRIKIEDIKDIKKAT